MSPDTRHEQTHPLVILVVDDASAARRHLAQTLKALGHRALSAENGRQALARLALGGVDLVLCDLILPDMDGLALLDEVSRMDAVVPVVLLTRPDGGDTARKALRGGLDQLLAKPVDSSLLAACLARASNGRGKAPHRAGAQAAPLGHRSEAAELERLRDLAQVISDTSLCLGANLHRLAYLARLHYPEAVGGEAPGIQGP